MNRYGASLGEGPRSGWYGNENWSAGSWARRWEEHADTADTELTRSEWMAKHRPQTLGTYLGEDRPQQREHKIAAGTCVTALDGNMWYRNADETTGSATRRGGL